MPSASAPDRTRIPRDIRGDIQGLRAVAVLVVIANHAGFGVPGGYVGVDVFFVISGFLITQLLLREIDARGRLSLVGFYARRARRILPAATLVALVTLVASVLFLSKIQADQLAFDALWASFFAVNVHLAARGVDYFSQGEPPSPLQHYWSLSVEEQFYLVWPLLLLACVLGVAALVRVRRRAGASEQQPEQRPEPRPNPGVPRRTVGVVLAVLTTASLVWSVVHTRDDPTAAYFSTTARAWELGLGACAALWGPALLRDVTARARGLLAGAGLVAIAVACATFGDHTAVPGYAVLLPVLGSALVLLSGVDRGTGVTGGRDPVATRLLSWGPLQRVGDWSFSLYLWHWPLLLIPELRVGHPLGVGVNLLLVAVAVALSAATYHLLETPLRTQRRLTPWRSVALYPLTLGLVAAGTFGGVAVLNHELTDGHHPAITLTDFGVDHVAHYRLPVGNPHRALVEASVIAARHGMAVPSHLQPALLDLRRDDPDVGACEYYNDSRALCPRGDPHGTRTMVVLGDSHGRMWIPALDQIAAASGYTVYYLVLPHCSPSAVPTVDATTGLPGPQCTDFNAWAAAQVARLRPDLTIVSTSPPSAGGGMFVDGHQVTDPHAVEAALRTGFTELFSRLQAESGRVVDLADVPAQYGDPAECLTTGHPDLGDCAFTPQARSLRLRDVTAQAAKALGVQVVNPTPWICWDDTCPAVVGDTVTYRDGDHLSATYAGELAPQLAKALGLTA